MKPQDYPREIERAVLDLAATNEELSTVCDQIRDAEMQTTQSVLNARGEEDKPLYTNDKARDLAVYNSLRANESYQRDKATKRILEHKRATLEAEIERLRRESRFAAIDYERQQLGRRDAA